MEQSSGGPGWGWGLTQRGRQVLAAQDLSVQLFCLLVLVLFQVGRGLRGGGGNRGSDLEHPRHTSPPPTS